MTISPTSCLVAVLAAALASHAAPAQQSDNEIRGENERLRTQVRDLERELDAARARIAELQRQVARLEGLLAAIRHGAPAPAATQPAPPVSVDESVPNASPRAMIAALVDSYRDVMADLEMGAPGDRQRIAYMRALEKWARRVNRELKSQIVWHVKVVAAPWHDSRYRRLEFVAVDPETGTELGEPFPAQVTRTVLRRIESFRELDVLRLKGVVLPNVQVNPYRDVAGAFDNPRFIGPFAECGLSVAVASISPPEDGPDPQRRRP